MKLSDFEYVLPPELVAQEPADKRDESKLLVLNRATGEIFHRQFKDILEFLKPFDCLALNRTKVIPARILGRKETGGKAEVLFLEFNAGQNGLTRALIKPFLPVGKKIIFPGGNCAVIEGKNGDGEALIRVSAGNIIEMLEEHGIMPLPPYIKRPSHCFVIKTRSGIKRFMPAKKARLPRLLPACILRLNCCRR